MVINLKNGHKHCVMLNTKMNSGEMQQVRKWKDRNCRAQNAANTPRGPSLGRLNSMCELNAKNPTAHSEFGSSTAMILLDFPLERSTRNGWIAIRTQRHKEGPTAPVSDATSTEGLKKTGDPSITNFFFSVLLVT